MLIEVSQKDEICYLRCEGRFVAATDPEYLRAKKNEIKALNCNKVLVDFRDVAVLGSTGIGFIVSVYTTAKKSDGRFVLVGTCARVREVLDITRVSTVIPMAADIASGLAFLRDESLTASSGQK